MAMAHGTQPVESFDIDEVRASWMGKVVAESTGRYPVEHDPIRRYCHMIGDLNPLFLDAEVAGSGPHGAVIAPLPFVTYFAGNGPWPRRTAEVGSVRGFTFGIPTPGTNGINLGTSWEYRAPARVGDRLRAQVSIRDVFIKPIKLDALAVWIVSETEIRNQRDEVVVVSTNTVVVHRAPHEIEQGQG
jgi:acyl dehydratase